MRSNVTVLPCEIYTAQLIVKMVYTFYFGWTVRTQRLVTYNNKTKNNNDRTETKYEKTLQNRIWNLCARTWKTQQIYGTHDITSGNLALRPYYFLNLHTWKWICSKTWTESPFPNNLVDAVHQLAAASKNAGGIPFTNEDGNIIADDDDEEEYNTKNYEHIPVTNNSPPDAEETVAISNRNMKM